MAFYKVYKSFQIVVRISLFFSFLVFLAIGCNSTKTEESPKTIHELTINDFLESQIYVIGKSRDAIFKVLGDANGWKLLDVGFPTKYEWYTANKEYKKISPWWSYQLYNERVLVIHFNKSGRCSDIYISNDFEQYLPISQMGGYPIKIEPPISQSEKDSLAVLYKMLADSGGKDYSKEIDQLKYNLKVEASYIANGIIAYSEGKFEEGRASYLNICDYSPNFEIMAKYFYRSVLDSDTKNKTCCDLLAKVIYESHLRDKQGLEVGCVLGLQNYYMEMIKNDSLKKASFDIWYAQKLDENRKKRIEQYKNNLK